MSSGVAVASPKRPWEPMPGDDDDEEGLRAAGRSPQRYALRVRDVNEVIVNHVGPGKKAITTTVARTATTTTPSFLILEVEFTGGSDDVEDVNDDDGSISNAKKKKKKACIIHSTVPRGFAIVNNNNDYSTTTNPCDDDGSTTTAAQASGGKKIIATMDYKRGSLLYVASCAILDLTPYGQRYELKIYSEGQQKEEGDENPNPYRTRLLDARVNTTTDTFNNNNNNFNNNTNDATLSVDDNTQHNDPRQVYGWDTFMTHSCNPNAYFPPVHKSNTECRYKAIALRDIYAGEEVTCDYATFDYSVAVSSTSSSTSGAEIEPCVCGSTNCRGKMVGFQDLSLIEKVDILHLVDSDVRTKFLQGTNSTLKKFRSHLPEGIDIDISGDQKLLVATRTFEVGDVIFENTIVQLMRSDGLDDEYLLEVDHGQGQKQQNMSYHLLSTDEHMIHRTDYVEMIGFDCFMQHSCSPNGHQVYRNETEYVIYATKTIEQGGTITCDYMALDNQVVGLESRPTIEFLCLCGEKNCRGMLRC